eukprot:m.291361 g.291361  ORF g.291361 m.291361 type:complete len:2463 (-) comp15826_c0_seq4:3727-11115(-)
MEPSAGRYKVLEDTLQSSLLTLKGTLQSGRVPNPKSKPQSEKDNFSTGASFSQRSALDFPLSDAFHRNLRNKLVDQANAIPHVFDHRYLSDDAAKARLLYCQQEYTKSTLVSALEKFYRDEELKAAVARKTLIQRMDALKIDPTRYSIALPGLTTAVEHLTSVEQEARERHRRIASAATALVPGATTAEVADIAPFLRSVVVEQASKRKLQFVLANCRWLPLARTPELKARMLGEQPLTSRTLHQALTHEARTAALMQSAGRSRRLDAVLSASDMDATTLTGAASSASAQPAGGGAAGASDDDGPGPLVGIKLCDDDLINYTLPINGVPVEAYKAWMMAMGATLGLSNVVLHDEDDYVRFYFDAQSVFHSLFPAQTHAEATKILTRDVARDAMNPDKATELDRDSLYVKHTAWLDMITLVARENHYQEKRTAHLLSLSRDTDELLQTESDFTKRHDVDYARLRLRLRAKLNNKMPRQQRKTLAVSSFQEGQVYSGSVWSKMYGNHGRAAELLAQTHRSSLALDDVTEGEDEVAEAKANAEREGYLGYLMLRHVHIRQLRREALHLLNYFRSVQKTVTLWHSHLELLADDTDVMYRPSKLRVNQRPTNREEDTGEARVAGMYQLPEEAVNAESDLVHDTYRVVDGIVHVYDANGLKVIYSESYNDFDELEQELLSLGTHYLQRSERAAHVAMREKAAAAARARPGSAQKKFRPRRPSSAKTPKKKMTAHVDVKEDADFDMELFGRGNVDRGAILLDLWSWEIKFLRQKRRVMDMYLYAHNQTSQYRQKQKLLQVITNTQYKRPAYDLENAYFVSSYRASCTQLQLEYLVLARVVSHAAEQHREHSRWVTALDVPLSATKGRGTGTGKATHSTGSDVGLVTGLPGSVLHDLSRHQGGEAPMQDETFLTSLAPIPDSTCSYPETHLLDLVDTMDCVSDIPEVLLFCHDQAKRICQPSTQLQSTQLYAAVCSDVLDVMDREFDGDTLEREASDPVRRLLIPHFMDSPVMVSGTLQGVFQQRTAEMEAKGGTEEVFLDECFKVACLVLEAVSQRHRLILHLHESLVLTKLYRSQCNYLLQGEHHAYLRPVTFANAGVSKAQSGASQEDPFVSARLDLALFELDDVMVDNLRLSTKEDLLSLLEKSSGRPTPSITQSKEEAKQRERMIYAGVLGDLQCAAHAQLMHVQTLATCVEHIDAYQGSHTVEAEAAREAIRQLRQSDEVAEVTPLHLAAKVGFISLQLIKREARLAMHDKYTALLSTTDPFLLKREMVWFFADELGRLLCPHHLRTQQAHYISSMRSLLDLFPSTRDYYFLPGSKALHAKRLKEAAGDRSVSTGLVQAKLSADELKEAEERFRKSPLQILSRDGKSLLNLWYIPYLEEIVTLFSKEKPKDQISSLKQFLDLVSSLHDIVMFLCAYARLGSSHARLGTYDVAFQGVGADWGGTEGIGTELRKMKKELGQLENATDPKAVADYLERKRNMMYLEWVLTVKYYVRETFLGRGSESAFNNVTANVLTGLPPLTRGTVHPCVSMLRYQHLTAKEGASRHHSVVSTYLSESGPFPLTQDNYQYTSNHMELCLAKLSDMDRHVANGEVLGISLLLEDISEQEFGSDDKHPLDRIKLLTNFLETSLQLEQLRDQWAAVRFSDAITSREKFLEFRQVYDQELVAPVVEAIKTSLQQSGSVSGQSAMPTAKSKVHSTAGLLVGHGTALELHGVPEWEYRKLLVAELKTQIKCLLATRTLSHVQELQQRLVLEMSDDGRIPYGLWRTLMRKPRVPTSASRKSTMKTLPRFEAPRYLSRSSFVQDFATDLAIAASSVEGDPSVVQISKQRLDECLHRLAVATTSREKERFTTFAALFEAVTTQLEAQVREKESEVAQMKSTFHRDSIQVKHEVQCALADRTAALVYEVTALRAKVSRLREEKKTQERDIRESVKRDYDDLVNNLFSTSFALKNRFEEYRLSLYDDVVEGMFEVRKTALQRMKAISVGKSTQKLEQGIQRAEDLRNVQSENANLTALVLKMRTMNDWKRTGLRSFYGHKVSVAHAVAGSVKRNLWELQHQAKEASLQHRLEITSLRAELVSAKKLIDELQIAHDEEKRMRQALQEWKASKIELIASIEAQASKFARLNMDPDDMVAELADKTDRIRELELHISRTDKAHDVALAKAQQEIKRLSLLLRSEVATKQELLSRGLDSSDEGDETAFARLSIASDGESDLPPPRIARRRSSLSMNEIQRRPSSRALTRTWSASNNGQATAATIVAAVHLTQETSDFHEESADEEQNWSLGDESSDVTSPKRSDSATSASSSSAYRARSAATRRTQPVVPPSSQRGAVDTLRRPTSGRPTSSRPLRAAARSGNTSTARGDSPARQPQSLSASRPQSGRPLSGQPTRPSSGRPTSGQPTRPASGRPVSGRSRPSRPSSGRSQPRATRAAWLQDQQEGDVTARLHSQLTTSPRMPRMGLGDEK